MEDLDAYPIRRRGTAILVTTIILVATSTGLLLLRPYGIGNASDVRIAVIDSGITLDARLRTRVVVSKSFINPDFGYDILDNSTEDSNPDGTPHGTYVARIIAGASPYSAIVNAKVIDANNKATHSGITAAIRWAVLEANCSVINLSLGGHPTHDDPIREAVLWANRIGVVIVAAAGNDGQDGIAGSSIESPAVLREVIGVAAVDEGGIPYPFSGRGPLRNGTAKPDIAAPGYFRDTWVTLFGTSFAAPHVSAACADLIRYCIDEGWSWTPGMIKATLLAGSKSLSSPNYEVGEGLLDLGSALKYMVNVPRRDNLPLVSYATPSKAPYDFERWFVNSTGRIEISVFTSDSDYWEIFYEGAGAYFTGGPLSIYVNQTASFEVQIKVISDSAVQNQRTSIVLVNEDYRYVRTNVQFDADVSIGRIAFIVSHTPWWIDSIYGQFRELYKLATSIGIAVEEIRDPELITLSHLSQYDAVLILDPCAYGYELRNDTQLPKRFRNLTQSQIDALEAYYDSGGNLMVFGLSNRSIDVASVNNLLSRFNMTFNFDMVPSTLIYVNHIPSTIEVTNFLAHPISEGISSIDYVGCSINTFGTTESLAWVTVRARDGMGIYYDINRTVVAITESNEGSRMLCAGSNFFIDNWGLSGAYMSHDNADFMRQAFYWILGNM